MAEPETRGDETLVADGPTELSDRGSARLGRGPSAQLAKGSVLGRYLVLERVGVGGMGEVYAAYDPELDRKVAIKLLHAQQGGGSTSTGGAARLVREAQAMARLTSPHVITVHDVGTFEDQVFMAMEFVEGRTLGQWLEDERPSWREALKVLVKAGRGLAAAHEAGLIHRDFKPDNVLLGDARAGNHQRVLVADFGLARASTAILPEPATPATDSHGQTSSSLDTRMTVTGAVMGTPAYMSPEAHAGALVDASGDQFGFCVALYEALYGERPHAGETVAALTFQVLHGEIREAPAGTKVPSWLRRVVLRGLARDPKDRYPDMDSLIRALVRDVGGERRRLGLIAAAIAVVVGGVGLGFALVEDEDPTRSCVAAEQLLVDVWDDARKQEIRAAIQATNIEYGPQTWGALETTLDAYTGEWLAMHRDACEATYLRQTQSTSMLDLQVACLGDRLQQLRSLTELLDQPDRELLAKVDQMAAALPRVARCGDAQALLARVAPPEDPTVIAEVERLRGELARVSAMRSAMRLEPALALADTLIEQAAALDYAPIEAEAHYERGRTRADLDEAEAAEDDLSRAVAGAIASGHDELIAKAGTALVTLCVTRQHRLREADHWQAIAAAGIEHLGGDVMLESNLLIRSARGLSDRGDLEGALAAASAGVALREQLLGPDHLDLAPGLAAVGRVHYMQGDLVNMQAISERVLELLERHYGPDHPALSTALSNLAAAHLLQGRPESAAAVFERVLLMRTQELGPDHISTVDVRSNLGITLVKLGKHAQAEPHLRHVQAIYEQRYGADNLDTGEAYVNLATAVEVRDRDLAIEYLERALTIFEANEGDQRRHFVLVLHMLVHHAQAQGDRVRGAELANRALELSRAVHGDQHADTLELVLDVASIELANGELRRARGLIEPALAKLQTGDEWVTTARAQFLLGQVMVDGGEREAGVAKIRASLAMLEPNSDGNGDNAHVGNLQRDEDAAELRKTISTWLENR